MLEFLKSGHALLLAVLSFHLAVEHECSRHRVRPWLPNGVTNSTPCSASGMCSQNATNLWVGPLNTIAALQSALHARSYRKEVSSFDVGCIVFLVLNLPTW